MIGLRVFVFFAGLVEIALGMALIDTHRSLRQDGVRTTGIVVANIRYVSKAGVSPTYYPRVRYGGPHGRTYVVDGDSRPTPQFRVGASATVYVRHEVAPFEWCPEGTPASVQAGP
jgi:hypothetical protein